MSGKTQWDRLQGKGKAVPVTNDPFNDPAWAEQAAASWGGMTDVEKQEFVGVVANSYIDNVMSIRKEWAAAQNDPRRKIERDCGWPDDISPKMYQNMFDRFSVAKRVVEMMPRESFQTWPYVYESEDRETETEFDKAWKNLGKMLRSEPSFHTQDRGSGIGELLLRADIQSGICRYGIIYLGMSDVTRESGPDKPVTPGAKLLFMRVFPETLCPITKLDSDPASPRHCMPTEYQVTFVDAGTAGADNEFATTSTSMPVHWSRVIHIADNRGSSEFLGVPRMQDVYNELLDLRKLKGGGAEGYWQACIPTTVVSTLPALGPNARVNRTELQEMFEQIRNGMQKEMVLRGLQASLLVPTVADLSPHWDKGIEAICIVKGWPGRIFKGSERGELASSQDDGSWNDELRARQEYYITPRIIVPLVDRLISLGVLPTPKEYYVEWPDLESQTEHEKADVALKKTQAICMFASQGGEAGMTWVDFFTSIIGMEDAEALQVRENVLKGVEESDKGGGTSLLHMVDGVSAMVSIFDSFKNGAFGEETLKQLIILFYGVDEKKAEEIIADGLPEPPVPELPPIPPGLKVAAANVPGKGGASAKFAAPAPKPAAPK